MKTKIILLSATLLLVPNVAQAKTNHNTNKYTYTYHRSQHIYCPYAGCKKSFSQYLGAGRQMSVVYGRLLLTTTEKDNNKMAKPMYQVGDLFTTTQSKVTGKIKEIIPVNARTTTLLLDVDGEERFTSVKL